MKKTKQRLAELLVLYMDGESTPAQQNELWEYTLDTEFEEIIRGLLPNAIASDLLLPSDGLSDLRQQVVLDNIFDQQEIEVVASPKWFDFKRIAIAASITFAVLTGGYFYYNNQTQSTESIAYENEIVPGKNGATLTLANGKKIRLSDAVNGELAEEAGVVISKTADGQLVYEIKEKHNSKKINTLSTSNGETYQVRLPDGTAVWLNAASSIKYPIAFSGAERRVEISGEVYFEVKHDASKPFRVVADEQTVEVLGTHFNINAYADEKAIKTTLLEGSVRVVANGNSAILKVGQASAVNENKISIGSADDAAVAWKDGYFEFSDTDIQTVMRQISRWYNVDVIYTGTIPQEIFTTRISRHKNISQVLNIIRASKSVNVEIQGRRIMVKN